MPLHTPAISSTSPQHVGSARRWHNAMWGGISPSWHKLLITCTALPLLGALSSPGFNNAPPPPNILLTVVLLFEHYWKKFKGVSRGDIPSTLFWSKTFLHVAGYEAKHALHVATCLSSLIFSAKILHKLWKDYTSYSPPYFLQVFLVVLFFFFLPSFGTTEASFLGSTTRKKSR